MSNKTDIEKAVFLLKEIDSWLSMNQRPTREELLKMRGSIQEFLKPFPDCWTCGDTGCLPTYDNSGGQPCNCIS